MNVFRFSLVAATLASVAMSFELVACGTDSANSPAPGTDGGDHPVDPGGGPTDGGTTGPVLTVSNARAKIYLGQTAKIDGAAVAPNITSDFSWTVIDAPYESAIKTASIEGATSATPSFKPDRLGGYTLQVSGKKNGVGSSVIVLVEAIDAPVFTRDLVLQQDNGANNDTVVSASTHVGGAYGTIDRTVGCPVVTTDGGVDPEAALFSVRWGSIVGDSWEGPPGTPARVVFPSFTSDNNLGAMTVTLAVATSQSACGDAEAKIIETRQSDGGSPSPFTDFIHNARFSPDGNRIAYLHDTGGRARIATTAFDGTAKRDLSPFVSEGGDAGLDPDAGTQPVNGPFPGDAVAPRWKDNSHVGWVTFVGPSATNYTRSDWELYVVEDKDGAAPELVMTCSDSGLQTFDFLPDGSIVAAARHTVSVDGGGDETPMDLFVYKPNAATKACEIVRRLTNNQSSNSLARDVALSPDKTQVAFFSGVGTGNIIGSDNSLFLFTVPVDGSKPAAQVPGASESGVIGSGPRWAAGGTVLTYGAVNADQGGGLPFGLGKLVSIPAAGGTARAITTGSTTESPLTDGGTHTEYHLTYSIGQGCSVTPGSARNGVMVVFTALGLTALVARRRRSKR
jgi:MYXO-CTERM domain-containing protein